MGKSPVCQSVSMYPKPVRVSYPHGLARALANRLYGIYFNPRENGKRKAELGNGKRNWGTENGTGEWQTRSEKHYSREHNRFPLFAINLFSAHGSHNKGVA